MKYNEETSWARNSEQQHFPTLQEKLFADVVIIGGGLTGVLTAYALAQEGKNVVVLEKNKIGSGATEMTTAFLTEIIDTDGRDLPGMIGEEKTRLVYASHKQAIEEIARVIALEKIECDFVRVPNRVFAAAPEEFETLKDEHTALTNAGVESTLHLGADLGFANYGHIEVTNQAKFHPLRFLRAVTNAAHGKGVKFFENTEALDARKESDVWVVETKEGTILSSNVISATYSPFKEPFGLYLKKGMYTSYVIEGTLPKGMIPEAIYEDTAVPYHYFRIDPGVEADRILIGGEDHRSDIPVDAEKSFSALREYAAALFGEHFHQHALWMGPVLEPSDGLALIGEHNEGGILYASAFSGNGMTYAMISALLLRDIIAKRENPWKELYNPDRFPSARSLITKGRDYSQEFLHGALRNTWKYRTRKN